MMPSAPLENAFINSMKSILPVQGSRMILTLEACFMRLVPVRSAPVYVHQLHTNATIFGSNSAIINSNRLLSLFRPHPRAAHPLPLSSEKRRGFSQDQA